MHENPDRLVSAIDNHWHVVDHEIRNLQKLLGVKPDGVIGPLTRAAAAERGGHNTGSNREILTAIETLKGTMIMALTALQTAVSSQTTVINGAVTLLDGLAAKIAALKPDQAAIDALAAEVTGSRDSLAAAVVRDTQAADEPQVPIDPSGNAP